MAEVEHVAKKPFAARDPMRNAARHIAHLAWIKLVHAPLGVVRGMAAKLKPYLVVVHAPMETGLLSFGVVGVGAKVLALVLLRPRTPAFSGHTGKIIEDSQHTRLSSFAALECDAAH